VRARTPSLALCALIREDTFTDRSPGASQRGQLGRGSTPGCKLVAGGADVESDRGRLRCDSRRPRPTSDNVCYVALGVARLDYADWTTSHRPY